LFLSPWNIPSRRKSKAKNMERELIVEHLRKRRRVIILTLVLLLITGAENYYLNCPEGFWCAFTLIYVILAISVFAVLFWYRK